MTVKLYDALESVKKIDKDHFLTDVPDYITGNLSKKLRKYQSNSIINSIYYFQQEHNHTHLLFHMATGSGKTLIMAGEMLHLYYKGYRNFMFFVNSVDVLNKTRENFLNSASGKYLFSQKIILDGKTIQIREVDNFQISDQNAINILFTTIQALHSNIHHPKENTTTIQDFKENKIVIISDEAHHINAFTKNRLNKTETIDKDTWESTVNEIFTTNPSNIMLEFTATINFDDTAISEKYNEITIYDYTLEQFREDGYSKEVNTLQSDTTPINRAIQAAILSQYRWRIASKNHIHLKPVVLMKSGKIKESNKNRDQFLNSIQNLTVEKLEKIRNYAKGNVLESAFNYFEHVDGGFGILVDELKNEFSAEKTLTINSQNDSIHNQILVNTLEDKNNIIRVLFVVNKLNEGWDVLNLFDIVKLNDSENSSKRTTISEAQLIGRGARYYPFKVKNAEIGSDPSKRKFDSDLENEMRVLEILHFHSQFSPKYISDLHDALTEIGIMSKSEIKVDMKIKDDFRSTEFYKTGNIYLNEKRKNYRENINNFNDLDLNFQFEHNLLTGLTFESTLMEDNPAHLRRTSQSFKLSNFGNAILQKSLQNLHFYKFNNLRIYFPKLKSIQEFIESDVFLGKINVTVTGIELRLDHMSNKAKLNTCISVLEKLSLNLKKSKSEYIGTMKFYPIPIRKKIRDKKIKIENAADNNGFGIAMGRMNEGLDLSRENWYVFDENYGTIEEKKLIILIYDKIKLLRTIFTDVFLLRNEDFFQIYKFDDGKAFEPDFVLFLKGSTDDSTIVYQLYIESKGEHLIEHDKWKEEFLTDIKENYVTDTILSNDKIKIIGLPFFNTKSQEKFWEKFKKELEILEEI
ncbi:MAG: DEAD/DEAH box helicase family protein [Nitrosopumilus sp.]|nr:DEAD/DEAH box helicase family protein [Nitrosopumilus sp.]